MIALVDWFSCSFKMQKSLRDIFTFFRLNFDDFIEGRGNKTLRYEASFWYDGISVYYNQKSDSSGRYYDTFINMSGTGCRRYETIRGLDFDWVGLFDEIEGTYPEGAHYSRIDLAVDIKDNTCPTMKSIIRQTERHMFVSKMRRVRTGHMDEEFVYFGSPESDTRMRIYNKALERGMPDQKWVRFECQLRNQSVTRFMNYLKQSNHEDNKLGHAYKDFVNDVVRYTSEPNMPTGDDSYNHNSGRLENSRWWNKFIDGAEKLCKFEMVGIEYNYTNMFRFADQQCGNILSAIVDANGGDVDAVLQIISRHKQSQTDKQRQAVREHQASEKLKQLRVELFGTE